MVNAAMASSYVAAPRPQQTYWHPYPMPVSGANQKAIPVHNHWSTGEETDSEPIGYDPRYGTLFFAQKALLYGPFSLTSTEDHVVLSQMPTFLQNRSKKCLYCIFEAYTAIQLGKSGLRARPRDPTTDRVFHFPGYYPTCLIISVLHSDEARKRAFAILVYHFKSRDIAAQAFRLLTDPIGLKRGIRTPYPPAPVKLVAQTRPRSRQIEVQSPHRLEWNDQAQLNRKPSVRRSGRRPSKPVERSIQIQRVPIHQHLGSPHICNGQRSSPINHRGGEPVFLLLGGKRYPLSMMREVLAQVDESWPYLECSSTVHRPRKRIRSSSAGNKSTTDDDAGIRPLRSSRRRTHSEHRSSQSSEPFVELVFDKLKNSPTLKNMDRTFRNTNGENGGQNSVTVIRLSRQGESDSDDDDDDDNNDQFGYYHPPPKGFQGDGSLVQHLYWRKRHGNSPAPESQWNNVQA